MVNAVHSFRVRSLQVLFLKNQAADRNPLLVADGRLSRHLRAPLPLLIAKPPRKKQNLRTSHVADDRKS